MGLMSMEKMELKEAQKDTLRELFTQLNAENISHESAISEIEEFIKDVIFCDCGELNYGYGDPTCNVCKRVVKNNPSPR